MLAARMYRCGLFIFTSRLRAAFCLGGVMRRIYMIYGGMYGWDGVITSAGLGQMAQECQLLGALKTYLQPFYMKCVGDILSAPKTDKTILIGYSGGSVMATVVCNELMKHQRVVDLFINL